LKAHAAAAARWTARIIVGFALLLVLAAAGLWWWTGHEGSLEWLLRRVAGSVPLQSEGVKGSIRGGWQIQRVVWERDGLRLEAEDVRLRWQPLALLERTLQLQQVHVARARVIDKRPDTGEPLKPPADLRLPWRVNADELKVDAFSYEGKTQVQASSLAAQYAYDGLKHQVGLKSLRLAGGDYRGELKLLALPPLTLDASLAGRFQAPVPGTEEKVPLAFQLKAAGPATAIDVRAQLQVVDGAAAGSPLPSATASARVAPFADMPVPRGEADFRRLDLAMFWPAAPRTQLSGHVAVVPKGTATFVLSADLRNDAAGPWDAKKLPVVTARGEGEWRDGAALVKSVLAEVGGGRVEGSGAWQGKGWHFDGRVDAVDPAALHTGMAPLPLTGPLKLKAEGKDITFDVNLQAGAPRGRVPRDSVAATVGALELRDALAQGRYTGDTVSLSQLRLRTSDAVLEGQLEWQLKAAAGDGKLSLRAPGLQAQARGSVAETRGQGSADITAPDLAVAQRWLARLPGVGGAVKGLSLRGSGQAQLAWQGGWRDPTVQANANLRSLAWQPARDGAPTPWVVREGTVQVNGRLRDAALVVRAAADQGQRKVNLDASGRLGATLGPATSWRGQLAAFSVQVQDPGITPGPWNLQLRRAVDWRLAGANFELSAGEALLRAPAMRSGVAASDAVLTWGPVRRQAGLLSTTGRLSGLPLAWLELFGGTQMAGSALSGDMVFDADWNAQLGSTVRVDASLARVRGDVTVLAESADGAAARVSAGVRDARVTVSSQGEQLVFSLLWDSERAGRAEGQVRTRLVRDADGGWSWPEQAPLSGRVQAQLPRIGVWSLLAPPGWRLRGSLSADIAIAGTRTQPDLSGPLLADDLALRSVVDGIELRNGRLRAQLAGQKIVVSEFLLRGSEEGSGTGGTLLAYGEGSWTPQGPVFQANAQLSQLRASIRSDRQLTVSGPVTARMDRGGTTVTGELQVDRARIQIPDESPPRLGEDVVVRNAPGVAATEEERKQRPPAASPQQGSKPLNLRVNFDLGNDFRVSGRGVDTRLAGSVQIQGSGGGMPQIVGLIRTVGGTYEAYGQKMNIERGELRFTGTPDNPALDILAIRPNMTQKVGVLVSGRAQSPHVELYSDAGLSDAETLSYVVLGRSSAGGGAETALLQRAATALLAGRGGTGKGLVGKLGLDDLSVRGDGTSGAVVRVGKRFADNFYAAYERSLSGAMGTLFIFYDVSRRLTVRAEAGERAGLDLIFTFAFDGRRNK
jgi:translocation and assembly module TamB